MALDVKLLYFFNNLTGKSKIFDTLAVFISSYLQHLLIGVFILLPYFSAYSRRRKLYMLLVTTTSAIVAYLGITEIIRFFYHRPRPFITHQLHPLLSQNEWSFPSSHAAFLFAMAMAIYLFNRKWGVGFFIAAILINISRIIAGVHYPSDILGGMIVGVFTAYVVFVLLKKTKGIINV